MGFKFKLSVAVYCFSTLGGKIVGNLPKRRISSEEYSQFIADIVRLILKLPDRPAVYVLAKVYHAVLLQKIVTEFVFSYYIFIV